MRILMAASSLVIVLATSAAAQVDGMEFGVTVPVSTTGSVVQDFLVPGLGENATTLDEFELTFDAPWLSVFPQRGALSAGGTTVQFTIQPGSSRGNDPDHSIRRTYSVVRSAQHPYHPFSVPRGSLTGSARPAPSCWTMINSARGPAVDALAGTARCPHTIPRHCRAYRLTFTPTETTAPKSMHITIAVAATQQSAQRV